MTPRLFFFFFGELKQHYPGKPHQCKLLFVLIFFPSFSRQSRTIVSKNFLSLNYLFDDQTRTGKTSLSVFEQTVRRAHLSFATTVIYNIYYTFASCRLYRPGTVNFHYKIQHCYFYRLMITRSYSIHWLPFYMQPVVYISLIHDNSVFRLCRFQFCRNH